MFEGFPEEHRAFFEAVAEDTTWETVSARAEQHRRTIYLPMCKLADELEAEFGPVKVYRLVAGRTLGGGGWLATREPLERVRAEWRNLKPLVSWLAEHVGPRTKRR